MTRVNDILNPEEVDGLKKVCVSPDSIFPHCYTPTLPLLQEHTILSSHVGALQRKLVKTNQNPGCCTEPRPADRLLIDLLVCYVVHAPPLHAIRDVVVSLGINLGAPLM